jgi:hypothetical protein
MASQPALVGKVKGIYYNGLDISSESNNIDLQHGIEDLPSDNFGAAFKDHEAGLAYCSGKVGIMLPGDHVLESALGDGVATSGNIISLLADGLGAGATSFALSGLSVERRRGLQIGQLYSTTLNVACKGAPGLLRGKLLEAVVSRSASANTAGIQFTGGVPAGQSLYIAYHVIEMTATNVAAVVQRDDNAGFTSALTAIAMTTFTGIGAEVKSVPGPITDDRFRLSFTLTGTGSYTVVAVLAVQ